MTTERLLYLPMKLRKPDRKVGGHAYAHHRHGAFNVVVWGFGLLTGADGLGGSFVRSYTFEQQGARRVRWRCRCGNRRNCRDRRCRAQRLYCCAAPELFDALLPRLESYER